MREYFVCGRIVLLTIALAGWTDPVLARSDDVRAGSPPPSGATADTPPRAYLAGPPRVEIGQLVTYDATRSSDLEEPNAALSYRYEWGDGSDPVTGVGHEWQTHAFGAAGSYQVQVTVTDSSGLSNTSGFEVDVIVPLDYGEICLTSSRHSGFDGIGFWDGWFLQHPNNDAGLMCALGYAPDRSWDTDVADSNVGLGPHNSIGISPPINSLAHGTSVEVQVDVMLNTEYDYQEGGENGYGLRDCGGGHLINLTTDGRGLTCREDPCPATCCPGDCIQNADDIGRFELDNVKNKGFRIVSWHPGLGPSNQVNDATVPGLDWTAGKWLRVRWRVDLLSNDGQNNQVRHTVTYISVDGVPLPQHDFTVEKTLTFNQPVQWRKIHFLSFGNFDLCPGRRQEQTLDIDQSGCDGPYLGRVNVRNIYVRDVE
jgi:hypothetical protein